MAIFGLWDSDRLVDPFLLSVIGSLFGVQAFQLAPFHFRGFFIPFTPSVGRFRDGVLFDSVPFLGFFPSKDFNSPLFPLEGLFLFLLRASRTSVCPLGGCFCSRVSRVFLFPCFLAFLDPFFLFLMVFPFSGSDVSILVGFFFSKGFSLSPFFPLLGSYLFSVPSLDSFLPEFLYRFRILFGWKIFIPSRGEFDFDSFKLPAVFLFELFCLGVFSWFSASRSWSMIYVLSCRLGFQRLVQRS